MSNTELSIHTRSLLTAISTRGSTALYGLDSLVLAREVFLELVSVSGYQLVFDPSSAPDLLDILGVAGLGALEGALLGGGLGSLLGAVLGYPAHGLILGAALGGLAGGSRGMNAIHRGLRVRVTWLTPGFPEVVVEAR
jgi:hypothetical protein